MTALPRFVAAGEALTDLLATGVPGTWTSQTGGSTWNVARVVARLGIPSAFAGAVSRDVFGVELAAANAAAGLHPGFLQQVDRPRDLKRRGTKISYDPNFRALMDERYDDILRTMVGLADVVKVSDEDLHGLFRHDDTDAAFAALRTMNPAATYLFTRGGAGARLVRPDGTWHAAAPRVDVVDTVGAGDASIGALVYSLMTWPELPGASHLRVAVAAGTAACRVAGAQPPTLDAVLALADAVAVRRDDALDFPASGQQYFGTTAER